MKKLLPLFALTMVSAAFAIPSSNTVEGIGNSTDQNFTINATVGDACRLSAPAAVTIDTPMYWTQDAQIVTGSTSVNVACNTGTYFNLFVSQPVTLTNTNSGAELLGHPYITDGTGNPYTAGGLTYSINVDVERPTQDNMSGQYSGVATVTLFLGID